MASDKSISRIIIVGGVSIISGVVLLGIYSDVSREGYVYVNPGERLDAIRERNRVTRETAIERLAELEVEKSRAERGYVLRERDLNGNGVPERFIEIEGVKYFLEIDGENLYDALKE